MLYTPTVFWMQIRIHDFFSEWRVILPYQTSVDTAISELQWMLHHTATLFFVVKAISSAALHLPLCFWCPMLFAVGDWVDMGYFQHCSISARSRRSFYRAVMLIELHTDMLLMSHIDLALGVVTAYQRQIWCWIPKTAKVNGRCTLFQHWRASQVKGIIIADLDPWDLLWDESSMCPLCATCQIQNWSNLYQEWENCNVLTTVH